MTIRGIDVSRWQGNINWNLVKDNGVEYAIIKAGGADTRIFYKPRTRNNSQKVRRND